MKRTPTLPLICFLFFASLGAVMGSTDVNTSTQQQHDYSFSKTTASSR